MPPSRGAGQPQAECQAECLGSDLASIYQVLTPPGLAGNGRLSRYPVLARAQLTLYPGRPDLRLAVDVQVLARLVLPRA